MPALSPELQQIITLARREAGAMGCTRLDVPHIFLALISPKKGPGRALVRELRIDYPELVNRLISLVKPASGKEIFDNQDYPSKLPFTPGTKQLFETAGTLGRQDEHGRRITPFHLLHAVLEDKESGIPKLLRELSRRRRFSWSPGVLFLDRELPSLSAELKKLSIRTIVPKIDNWMQVYGERYPARRIVVTCRPEDFLESSPRHGYGIIATGNTNQDEPQKLARLIRAAIEKHGLWEKEKTFLVYLKARGSSLYQELPG